MMEGCSELEDFVPLRASLEREQYTLQQLNSSDGSNETEVPICWNGWTMDHDIYFSLIPCFLDYPKFSSHLGDKKTSTQEQKEDWSSQTQQMQSCTSSSKQRISSDSANKGGQPVYSDIQCAETDEDLVVLGVGLESLSSVLATRNHSPTTDAEDPPACTVNIPKAIRTRPRQRRTPRQDPTPENLGDLAKVVHGQLGDRRKYSPRGKRGEVLTCPYPECKQEYFKKSHMYAHLRRHTGEKPFKCTHPGCPWRFSRSDELTRHERSHSGVKPYVCTTCDRRFSRSDHLSKHLRIHQKNDSGKDSNCSSTGWELWNGHQPQVRAARK